MHSHFYVYLQVSRCQDLQVLQECIYYPLCQLIRGSDIGSKASRLMKITSTLPPVPSNGRTPLTEEKWHFLFPQKLTCGKFFHISWPSYKKKTHFHNLTEFLKITACHPKAVTLKETSIAYQRNKSTILDRWLNYLFILCTENIPKKSRRVIIVKE